MLRIEPDTIFGQPSMTIVGLGDAAVKESKQRLESAIINSIQFVYIYYKI